VNAIENVNTLTFDLFGTVLDLEGSIAEPLDRLLKSKGATIDGRVMWQQWRARQRIEQFQDSLMMMGHSGYLEVARRGILYVLRQNQVSFTYDEVDQLMESWQDLVPFEDSVPGLTLLKGRYRLVGLSNGEQSYLEHLAKNRIRFDFDELISVERAGFFKPYPGVYRAGARILKAEPQELMHVAAHSFDIMGARSCGFRGAWVNRYKLPFEETPYQPDIVVNDFRELATRLP